MQLKDFLEKLQEAGQGYLGSSRTAFNTVFNAASSDSNTCATTLSKLEPSSDSVVKNLQGTETALATVHTFILKLGSHQSRFWNSWLEPIFVQLARSPLEGLSDRQVVKYQKEEFTTIASNIERSEILVERLQQFYSGLGYGKTSTERYPTLDDAIITPQGRQAVVKCETTEGMFVAFDSLAMLKRFFKLYPQLKPAEFGPDNKFGDPFLEHFSDRTSVDVIYSLLHDRDLAETSMQRFFPAFLYSFAYFNDRTETTVLSVIYTQPPEASKMENTPVIINCIKKMMELSPENTKLNGQQLLAIIQRQPELFYAESYKEEDLAKAIAGNVDWHQALITDPIGSIVLSKFLESIEAGRIQSRTEAIRDEAAANSKNEVVCAIC